MASWQPRKPICVREFAELAFGLAGLDYRKYVTADQELFRPAEVDVLVGNPEKAHRVFGMVAQDELRRAGSRNAGG